MPPLTPSLPRPPSRFLLPPKARRSLPPKSQSLPSPPKRLSLPPRAKRTSLPPLPRRLSALLVPCKVSGPLVPILVTARATPLATNRVRAMVANNTMVRLIRRPAFLQGNGVSSVCSVVRLASQRPFVSNRRTILPYRGRCITQMGYLWCCLGVACYSELPRTLVMRTSENPQNANFAFTAFSEVRKESCKKYCN